MVPANVTGLNVTLAGAAGGAGGKEGGSGGRGAVGTVYVPVEPGDTVTMLLGGRGQDGSPDASFGEGFPQPHGGAATGGPGGEGLGAFVAYGGAGGAGGGATEVFVNGERVAVAGGGGGGGGTGAFINTGGEGGNADADGGAGGGGDGSWGGEDGDAQTQAGGEGDDAILLPGGGSGGGGGGYPTGGSQGATFADNGGGGGGGGRSWVNPDPSKAALVSPWTSTREGNGTVLLQWNTQFDTTTTITAPGGAVTGQQVPFTVTVTPEAGGQVPTGTVELFAENDNTGVVTPLGTKNLVNGSAKIFYHPTPGTPGLKVGQYTLTAVYTPNGNSDSLPSTGTAPWTVVKGNTQVLLAGPLDPPNYGDVVDFGVTVLPVDPALGTPTGKVVFRTNGNAVIGGTVTLDANGQATLTTHRLPVGTQNITAEYLGDKEFNGSESTIADFVVNQGDVNVALSMPHTTVIKGEKSIFDVKVTATKPTQVDPTGNIQLYVYDQPLGAPVAIDDDGEAHFEIEMPVTEPDAHHHVRAHYVGDANFDEAYSNYVDHVVNFGSAKVKLTSDVNPSHAGQLVTFSIDVDGNLPTKPYEPTGEVQLYVNGTAFNAPVAIDANGQATVQTDDLPVGDNVVTATYLGDDNYEEATSNPLVQVVEKQLVTVALTANDTDLQYGQLLELTAAVTTENGAVATGTVRFLDNGVYVSGPIPVDDAGVATWTIAKPSKGLHTYTAEYSGDDNTIQGISNVLQVVVRANLLDFTVISTKMPAFQGERIAYRTLVKPRPGGFGPIAGTLQYYVDGSKWGKPTPVKGTQWGEKVIKRLRPGVPHLVWATFTPAANSFYDATHSDKVFQDVLKGKAKVEVDLKVKRTGATSGLLRVKAHKKGGGAVRGAIKIYVDGVSYKTISLAPGGGWTQVSLPGIASRAVPVTVTYRPPHSQKALRRASASGLVPGL
ncbi:Ig-like domain-containing protein [Nocardioides sp. SYSU D00038]|uniref:Ig-like domain-containing protein n=1 Tax=Nocardioides sp. SYSU D00038 TaxID=2812554 RepID=UPI001967AA68|nr:Ig-like domain-containing protein [Nocardioides sp. SYSU D00038]